MEKHIDVRLGLLLPIYWYVSAYFQMVKSTYVTSLLLTSDLFQRKVGRWKDCKLTFVHQNIRVANACTTQIPLSKSSWLSWYSDKPKEDPIYPTSPLGQDIKQGQFLSKV